MRKIGQSVNHSQGGVWFIEIGTEKIHRGSGGSKVGAGWGRSEQVGAGRSRSEQFGAGQGRSEQVGAGLQGK